MAELHPDVTTLLSLAQHGDRSSEADLYCLVEDELRRISEGYLRRERTDHTLQATILIDDAFMNLVGPNCDVDWQGRSHFYRAAAQAMRRILLDYERQRARQKRGGQMQRAAIDLDEIEEQQRKIDVRALHEALQVLAELNTRQAEVVRLRHFGGYTLAETAKILDVSQRTVKREWTAARAWLHLQLSDQYAH